MTVELTEHERCLIDGLTLAAEIWNRLGASDAHIRDAFGYGIGLASRAAIAQVARRAGMAPASVSGLLPRVIRGED